MPNKEKPKDKQKPEDKPKTEKPIEPILSPKQPKPSVDVTR